MLFFSIALLYSYSFIDIFQVDIGTSVAVIVREPVSELLSEQRT